MPILACSRFDGEPSLELNRGLHILSRNLLLVFGAAPCLKAVERTRTSDIVTGTVEFSESCRLIRASDLTGVWSHTKSEILCCCFWYCAFKRSSISLLRSASSFSSALCLKVSKTCAGQSLGGKHRASLPHCPLETPLGHPGPERLTI
jgi:hypothetical protein